MAAEDLPVELACRILGVSVAGYYTWRNRPPSPRAIRHAWLTDVIAGVHQDSRQTYGARRVHAELTMGLGIVVSHGAVEMLMQRANIQGLSGRPRFRRVPHVATASDLVERRFRRDDPDRLWVTDITEHPTREGKLYCAVVLDVFSRRVVGWSIDSNQETSLVTSALGMAIANREPADDTIIHSDRVLKVKSTGRRNTSILEVSHGDDARAQREVQLYRGHIPLREGQGSRGVRTGSGSGRDRSRREDRRCRR